MIGFMIPSSEFDEVRETQKNIYCFNEITRRVNFCITDPVNTISCIVLQAFFNMNDY